VYSVINFIRQGSWIIRIGHYGHDWNYRNDDHYSHEE
jgi:hypothetical protein